MNQTFKYSTVLAKIVILGLILAAVLLSSTRTFASKLTANEQMVLQSVRLSLWYEGTTEGEVEEAPKNMNVASIQEFYPEELYRALEKHDEHRLEVRNR